jgi:hypothetical protein
MMSGGEGGGESKMTPKNRIIEGGNRIKGGGRGGGSKMNQKNWTSFMHDPYTYFHTYTK